MRMILYGAVAAALILYSPSGRCQSQEHQQEQGAPSASAAGQTAAPSQASGNTAPQQESLAEAARKAREEKKALPKAATVFTNDNLPPEGAAPKPQVTAAAAGEAPAPPAGEAPKVLSGTDEKGWRTRFADLRHKLEQDQADLAVMQRELGVLNEQYYSDPNKAMREQFSRDEINKKTADIEARRKQVAADQQAIDDAETELRQAGGDPGWAR